MVTIIMDTSIMDTSIMDTSIMDTCIIGSCIIDICMIDSCIIEVEKEVLVDFQLPKGAKHHTYMRQGQGSNSFLPSFRNKNSAASSWTCLLIVPSDAHKKSHSRDALFSSSFHVLCYECLLTGRMRPLSLWTTLFRIARFVHQPSSPGHRPAWPGNIQVIWALNIMRGIFDWA